MKRLFSLLAILVGLTGLFWSLWEAAYIKGTQDSYSEVARLICTQDESGTYDKCVDSQLKWYKSQAHTFKGK